MTVVPAGCISRAVPAGAHHHGAGTCIRSVKYIREGLSALWHGKLSVAVLDATAVTVSMARGDFATAGSVMFMLRLGEILEEWTHKKSVADLAGAMTLQVDQRLAAGRRHRGADPHRPTSEAGGPHRRSAPAA